jgi:hypothetical protein
VQHQRATRFTSSGFFIALLLVAFSASGLMAGLVTRQVAGASERRGPTARATATPTATATTAPTDGTPFATSAFALSLLLTPSRIKAGQTLQIQATAHTTDGETPVPGVRCALVPPDAGPQLFATLPGPQLTDASGQAAWNVVVLDQTAPGAYKVSLRGDGASYHWTGFTTLTVTA